MFTSSDSFLVSVGMQVEYVGSLSFFMVVQCFWFDMVTVCLKVESAIFYEMMFETEDGIYISFADLRPYTSQDQACTKELSEWFSKQFDVVGTLLYPHGTSHQMSNQCEKNGIVVFHKDWGYLIEAKKHRSEK